MPRSRSPVPAYRHHKPSDRAVVTVYLGDGSRRDVYLPGRHGSAESRAAYARLCGELRPGGVMPDARPEFTITDLCVAYLKHAEAYYGAKTKECGSIRDALRLLRAAEGGTPAGSVGPLALRGVREAMVAKGWSRQYCNRQTGRLIRAFKWAAAEELLPAAAYQAIKTLAPLRAGKTAAPEAPPRRPADPAAVAATVPFLPPHVRALVELIRVTGMRPSECCRLTLGQIDRGKPVWVYTMAAHKTAHRGKCRVVHLGAAAQAVILAHLGDTRLGPDEPLFSPRRQREERYARLRAGRKSKVQPSQANRGKATPKKLPGERFTPEAVCHAVTKARKAADARAKAEARARGADPETAGVPPWSPYQLRHLVGAELREKFSLEHVRAALGHSHAGMSAHYAAGADAKLADEVATKSG